MTSRLLGRVPKLRTTLAMVSILAVSTTPSTFAGSCGGNTPATTVPQFRSEAGGGNSIWPVDGSSQATFRPASNITARRDSTDYITQTIPGAQSGHELYQSVATTDDYLFAAYNAGISAWDLRNTPQDPPRVHYRDGWQGHFFEFPLPGEADTFVQDIDAIEAPASPGIIYVAVASRLGVGVSLWRFTTSNQLFTQIYQSESVESRQVSIINHTNGRTYAFISLDEGVDVYDVTQADAIGPCLQGAGGCTGIYRGRLGTMDEGAYVDVIQRDGDIYVAASDGNPLPAAPLRMQIWEVPNPANPGGAILKHSSSIVSSNTRAVQLFSLTSPTPSYYLALVENNQAKIFDVDNCLDANGCTSMPLEWTSGTLRHASFQFLDFSMSGSRPFLYYGFETAPFDGADGEYLWDVSALSTGGNPTDITATGATYTDPCNGETQIGYWADYYAENEYGLQNLIPRHGVFQGAYFYRAALGILDVHQLTTTVIVPSITTFTTDPGINGSGNVFWMDEAVGHDTTVNNCTAGAGQWCWLIEPTSGDVSFTPVPANQVTGCDSSFSSPQDFTYQCDAAGRCDDSTVMITAWNENCGSIAAGAQAGDEYTVKDPTVAIQPPLRSDVAPLTSPSGTDFQQCEIVRFTGTTLGRGPVSWQWRIDGETIASCNGSAGDVDLATLTPTCDWDTSSISIGPDIFMDGFESGDCSAWLLTSDADCPDVAVASTPAKMSLHERIQQFGAINVSAELVVYDSSPSTPLDTESLIITVNEVGDPAFAGALPAPIVNGNSATFSAPANGTTLWSWEFEDPNGSSTCTFGGQPGISCSTQETSTDATTYSWIGAGTFRYNVTISNCVSAMTETASGDVTVDPGIQPDVVNFVFNGVNPSCCGNVVSGFKCLAGTSVAFSVNVATASAFNWAFDWERESQATTTYTAQGPSGQSGTQYDFVHFFATPSGSQKNVFPIVRASSGSLSDEQSFFAVPLTILASGPCS